MRKTRLKIYQTRRHLLITSAVVILPFFFLLLFSSGANTSGEDLFLDMATSVVRMFIAYLIAVVLGWSAAVLLYRGKKAAVALPVFDVLQSFPTFAALPLATAFWGASNQTVIFFLVVAIIWPIFFSVISSLRLMKHDWEEAVAISGLTGFDYVRHFIWPVSIPGLITGTIIGLGDGWEALIATEIIVGIKSGLGNFFQSVTGNITGTVFGITAFLGLIFVINKLVWLPLLERSHEHMEE